MENNFNSNETNNYEQQRPAYKNIDTSPLSLGQYLGMMLLMLIPIANIILVLLWSFGDFNVNRKNYARATLIIFIIGFILTVIGIFTLGYSFIRSNNFDPNII